MTTEEVKADSGVFLYGLRAELRNRSYRPGPVLRVGCLQKGFRTKRRTWLRWKYDRTLNRYAFFTDERLHGQYQLWKMPTTANWTLKPQR